MHWVKTSWTDSNTEYQKKEGVEVRQIKKNVGFGAVSNKCNKS